MHSDKKRRRRDTWPVAGESDPQVIEVESVNSRTVRAPERRSTPARLDRPGSGRTPAGDDDTVQRVGSRRRVRPELMVLLAGAVFLTGALLKPWSGPTPTQTPSPIARPPIALVPAAPPTTEAPSPGPLDGFPVAPVRGLVAVDWRTLSIADTHSDWGVAAATLPTGATSADTAGQAPRISWQPAVTDSSTATVTIDPSREVFGVAITWPDGFDAQDVVFTYEGPGPTSSVYYENPMVRQGATQVKMLPADEVAFNPPSPTPGPLAIHSGQFWVAPLVGPPAVGLAPTADAWKIVHWAWPTGDYSVLVAVPAGYETLRIRIGPYG